ncbi:hypothetical protein HMPREF1128_0478 [Haemophilus sputorum HK 2154]|jgi:hypothetical protein|nr:hypothetical protein HMPREF1128_0478 [Haemophilus sputorum HK 2154]
MLFLAIKFDMNIRLTAILLIIAAGLGSWWYSLQPKDANPLDNLIKQQGTPDYTGEKLSTEVFDLQGKPQYYAEAQEIKRFEETELTEFVRPLVNLFDKESSQKLWELTANQAEITKEKILTLSGNVKLNALDKTSRLQRIETEKLIVDLNTQDIQTDESVKSTGLGFTTTGVGLKGNLKQQVATLLKDVKSFIEPTVVRENNEQPTP